MNGLTRGVVLLVLVGCGGRDTVGGPIRVSDATLFGDLDCFKVETPTATYLYGKKGAGFASILDPDGRLDLLPPRGQGGGRVPRPPEVRPADEVLPRGLRI